MKNKDKLILGVIVAAIIVVIAGGYIFSQPSGNSTLSILNQSTDQGTVNQGTGQDSGNQVTGTQNKNNGSTNKNSTNPGTTGSQYKTCTKCGGKGTIEETVWTKEKCDVCDGAGKIWVEGLHRYVDCTYCDGGYNNVPHTYKKTCDACGGTGKVKA